MDTKMVPMTRQHDVIRNSVWLRNFLKQLANIFEVAGFLGKSGEDRVPRNGGFNFHVLKHTNNGIYVTAQNEGDEFVRGNDVVIVKLVLMGV